MSKETGGPAFPLPAEWNGPELINYTQTGMTLRDYFAAKAMQSLLTATAAFGSKIQSPSFEEIPGCAYEMADAMLEAREEAI